MVNGQWSLDRETALASLWDAGANRQSQMTNPQ